MGTPIGRILLMPKGDYSGSAVYNALDWVRHAGSAWVCTTDNTTGVTPAVGVPQWTVMASDGSIGGWSSLADKPFETLGNGVKKDIDDSLTLDIDTSLLLGSKLSVNTQDTYTPSDSNPISGQGVADALTDYYDKSDTDDKLDEYTASVSPVLGVVTFTNLDPDYGYKLCVDIPDESEVTLPTSLSDLDIPKWSKLQRSTNVDGTINLAYTVTDTTVQYCLRILK